MRGWIPAFLFGVAISVVVTRAHHSTAAVYDGSRQITVEGVVARFHFVNPHPFVTMYVEQASGITQLWQLEMDNRVELVQIGMTSASLKEGDRLVVTGNPARRKPQRLYIRQLDRPTDGFGYEQIGSSPHRVRPRC